MISRYFSLAFGNPVERVAISAAIAIAEGLSHSYDNLLIAAVVMSSYFALGQPEAKVWR